MKMMANDKLYQICRTIFAPVFRTIFHPQLVNEDRIPIEGSIILAGNHKHALDPLLVDISTRRTVHTLAKSELFNGCFGFFFSRIGAIPVDLDAAKNPQAYASAREALRNGEVINISPEAARNYSDEILLPFKTGAVRLAKETGTKILPYCITGDYTFRSRSLRIVFGDLIEIREEEIAEANKVLYDAIRTLLLENRND